LAERKIGLTLAREEKPMPDSPTTIKNLGVAMFTVSDQDDAAAFYTEKLGFEVRGAGGCAGAGVTRGLEAAPPGPAAGLPLTPPRRDEPGGSTIGVESDDVLGEHRRLSEIGGVDLDPEPMQAPGAPLMFGLRDPDGNNIFVVESPEVRD